ncbi:MAG TPA: UdgX family uracil-DNA binding protein [Candidatus Limnocylindrales bacterium]|nr:UdgX family uracil-DNA binding protein [Candidatus Limnocylindrales bacterium]
MRLNNIEPNFESWQSAARGALHDELSPSDVVWNSSAGEPSLDLFGGAGRAVPAAQGSVDDDAHTGGAVGTERRAFRVPAAFLKTARVVALHSDESRWSLLYRVLWRLTHGEPKLLEIPTDRDVVALRHMEQEVRKDAYRMRQYVRFRETQLEGERWFVAWYEPEHESIQLNERFFADRFTNMRWSILTPKRCMHWNGEEISFSAGADKSRAPLADDVESLWITYYSSIFNPARVKVRAMKAQMPVRNWKNLPEANAIAPLLANAPIRVNAMIERSELQRVHDSDYSLAQPPQTRDWPLLRDAARTCKACPLWRNATCTVFGEGSLDARVVLVGEQPGNDEDLAGKPFIGPAGQVLDRALAAAGIGRSQLYVTNAVKHFQWEPRGKRRIHKRPGARDIAACRPWLEAELELLKPELVVALGATAARSLFDTQIGVTETRGRILDSRFGPTLVTIHPSALLRLPPGAQYESGFQKFVADLRQML